MPDNAKPRPSRRVSGPRRSGMKRSASTMPTTPIGRLIKKIQRQSNIVVIKPPSGGPITGATRAGTVNQLIAETSSFFGIERKITSRPTGTIKAPPAPCSARAAIRPSSDDDAAHARLPKRKTMIAPMNVRRAPTLSATQPLIGMKTASAIRYVVIANFKAIGLVPRSTAIIGNEVAITVESMFSMNSAVATIKGRSRAGFTRSP